MFGSVSVSLGHAQLSWSPISGPRLTGCVRCVRTGFIGRVCLSVRELQTHCAGFVVVLCGVGNYMSESGAGALFTRRKPG